MTEHFLVPADLWTELFTYIAARVDVRDGGDGKQLPNSAMTLYDRMEREAKLARPEEERIDPWETLSLAALQLSMPSKFKEGAALETIESALRSREPQKERQ